MKKIILFIFILITSVHLKSQVLNVTEVIQEHNQWCWAAVSACVLDYYCTPTPQCVIAEYTRTVATWHNFGDTNCCVNPLLGCNYWNYNWGFDGSIQDILVHFGNISNSGVGTSLTQGEITSDIQDDKLFVIRWGLSGGGGHFVVGHGIVGSNIYYMDPWFGEGLKIADYSWVVSGANHTWTHTNQVTIIPIGNHPGNAGTIIGDTIVCQRQYSVTYSVPTIAYASSYVWTLPNGATGTSTTNSIYVDFDSTAISGNITVKGVNNCGEGNSSTQTIIVNEAPSTPTIVLNNDRLVSSSETGNQWYNQDGIMPSETNQELILTENGTYYVIVTQNDCPSDQSNSIHVDNVSVQNYDKNRIIISPNPFTNFLTIKNQTSETYQYTMYNSIGQIVFKGILETEVNLNTSGLSKGLYIIKFVDDSGDIYYKVIKQ